MSQAQVAPPLGGRAAVRGARQFGRDRRHREWRPRDRRRGLVADADHLELSSVDRPALPSPSTARTMASCSRRTPMRSPPTTTSRSRGRARCCPTIWRPSGAHPGIYSFVTGAPDLPASPTLTLNGAGDLHLQRRQLADRQCPCRTWSGPPARCNIFTGASARRRPSTASPSKGTRDRERQYHGRRRGRSGRGEALAGTGERPVRQSDGGQWRPAYDWRLRHARWHAPSSRSIRQPSHAGTVGAAYFPAGP